MIFQEPATHEQIIKELESGQESKHKYLLEFDSIILKDLDLIQAE